MPSGGARTGAGRKSAWSSSKTRNVRVPEYLADEVLVFAKKLDRERSLAAKQEHLASLLEEFLQLSQENKKDWVDKLPEVYEAIKSVRGERGKLRSQLIGIKEFEDDENQTEVKQLNWTLHDFEELKLLRLSNGCEIRLKSQDGRLICPLRGLPNETVTVVLDDNGEVYLRICSDWNLSQLISEKPVTLEKSDSNFKKSKAHGVKGSRSKKHGTAEAEEVDMS